MGSKTACGQVHAGWGNDLLLFGGSGSDDFYGDDADDRMYILGNDDVIDGGASYDLAIIVDTGG